MEIKTYIIVFIFEKASIIIIIKYFNYSNFFIAKNIVKLSKYTKINKFTIKIEKDN